MSMREQTGDVGVMKSLGFTDTDVFGLFMAQAMFLCLLGGGIGLFLAWSTQGLIASWMEFMFPGYSIRTATFVLAAVLTAVLGLLAGILPAVRASRLRCVEALRAAD